MSDELTVTIGSWSADELVGRVAQNLAKDLESRVSDAVSEIVGESLTDLLRERVDEHLSREVSEIMAETFTPVDEAGNESVDSTLRGYIRACIDAYAKEPVEKDRHSGEWKVRRDTYGGRGTPRFKALVQDAVERAAGDLVKTEIDEHVKRMRAEAKAGVKEMIAEHILSAAEQRKLNGGIAR